MGMAMEGQIGTGTVERFAEPIAAQKRVYLQTLSGKRLLDRRIMQERHATVGAFAPLAASSQMFGAIMGGDAAAFAEGVERARVADVADAHVTVFEAWQSVHTGAAAPSSLPRPPRIKASCGRPSAPHRRQSPRRHPRRHGLDKAARQSQDRAPSSTAATPC